MPRNTKNAGIGRKRKRVKTRTAPKIRKKTKIVASSQKDLTYSADPNEGRCLVTNRPKPVRSCHLVAQATDHQTLTKLEYAWGLKYRCFNVGTMYNMMHLRFDWQFLFDQSEWILVPEMEILQQLSEIYVDGKCTTSDLTKLFAEPTYRYYVVPAPTLQEPIFRFSDVNSYVHEAHFPPFSNLGPLTSHIRPHFVVFNTGKKLSSTLGKRVSRMTLTLRQIVPPSSDALAMMLAIQKLYDAWTEVQVPDHFYGIVGTPNRVDRSQGQGTQVSDSSSVTDDTVIEDDTAWIEHIHNWQKQGKGVAESCESDVVHDSCDEQLAAYIDEHARTPPSPGAWGSWKPCWDNRKSRYPSESDRTQFSSNDWAVFKHDAYLTRPDRPRVTV